MIEREKELHCSQPERLKDNLLLSLNPIDFCPLPLISLIEIVSLNYDSVTIHWDVQNDTLIGGFTLDYHHSKQNNLPIASESRQLTSNDRKLKLDGLQSETYYTICIQANGKYLRMFNNKPSPYVIDHQRNYLDYSSTNRKCLQVG